MDRPDPAADARRAAQVFGLQAESFVVQALLASGWQVLARNWRITGGEADVIVLRDRQLRLVEVKARTDASIDPLESVDHGKRRRLAVVADAWIEAHQVDADEVAVLVAVVDATREPWSIQWIDDAFDGS